LDEPAVGAYCALARANIVKAVERLIADGMIQQKICFFDLRYAMFIFRHGWKLGIAAFIRFLMDFWDKSDSKISFSSLKNVLIIYDFIFNLK
jgi:hypothetical protein